MNANDIDGSPLEGREWRDIVRHPELLDGDVCSLLHHALLAVRRNASRHIDGGRGAARVVVSCVLGPVFKPIPPEADGIAAAMRIHPLAAADALERLGLTAAAEHLRLRDHYHGCWVRRWLDREVLSLDRRG